MKISTIDELQLVTAWEAMGAHPPIDIAGLDIFEGTHPERGHMILIASPLTRGSYLQIVA